MADQDGGIVIIGGGECGARAAFTLREEGWTGPVTLIGRETLHAYERPPLSKAALTSDNADPVHPYPREMYDASGITLLVSQDVTAIDPKGHHVVLDGGREVPYERLLLTLGARARQLPFPAGLGLLHLRTHEDAAAIKHELLPGRRIGILGAGFIGLELAASARSAGCDVTVIEAADRALGRAVPASIAALVVAVHEARGTKFRWGSMVTDIRRGGAELVATLASGEVCAFDAIVVGVGATPNVELAQSAGLHVDNGIALDDRLRASDPDIFAAGDCASFPHPVFGGARIRLESWRNAHEQAVTAAKNLVGADVPHTAIPWFWSDQFDHTLQVCGLSAVATQLVERHRDDGVTLQFGLGDQGQLVSASAFGPGNSVARDIRLSELMVERMARPAPEALADPAQPLKKLLASSPGRQR